MLEIVAEPLVPGAVLAGAYRLERVLGEGGMGVVWAATELATQHSVAVKVLAEDRAADPTQQARILREAAAAKEIDHPNVVKVSAVLETDAGVPFIVMERLEGESLRGLLQRRPKLDLDATVKTFEAVFDAVGAAHKAGILHRDLKPENVFVTKTGAIKVLDFGIAKKLTRAELETATASLTETGALIGTPHYMAPEQVFGDEDVDARADIWSLGVMLYECLGGERPTEGDGFGQILKRITSASFRPLSELRPDVPPRLAQLVTKMLARDRGTRPSLLEARAKLGELDLPPSVVPEEPLGPSPTAITAEHPAPTRREPWRWVAAGAVALALGMGGYAIKLARAKPASEPDGPDQMNLLLDASNWQSKMNGAQCLASLDAFDKSPRRTLPDSYSLDAGTVGVRASCMMLMGKCEEGKKLYREWVPLHSPPMEAPYYDTAAEQMAGLYCPDGGYYWSHDQ